MGERRKRSGRAEPGVTSRTDGSLRSREADRALHRSAEKRPADWPAGLQSAAETCASLAHAALEQRDVAGARAQFEEGLRVLTPAGPKARWSYALGAGVSLCELDDGHGLDDALVAAVDFCQLALIYAPRDREPTLWAMAQTNLGRTLGLIGKRESGTARLEQAVAAFRLGFPVRERRTQLAGRAPSGQVESARPPGLRRAYECPCVVPLFHPARPSISQRARRPAPYKSSHWHGDGSAPLR